MSNQWCVKVRSGLAYVFRNRKPLSNSNGEEYGHILKFSLHHHDESQKQVVKVECYLDGKGKSGALFKAKYFDPSASHTDFQACTSQDCSSLVNDLNEALERATAGSSSGVDGTSGTFSLTGGTSKTSSLADRTSESSSLTDRTSGTSRLTVGTSGTSSLTDRTSVTSSLAHRTSRISGLADRNSRTFTLADIIAETSSLADRNSRTSSLADRTLETCSEADGSPEAITAMTERTNNSAHTSRKRKQNTSGVRNDSPQDPGNKSSKSKKGRNFSSSSSVSPSTVETPLLDDMQESCENCLVSTTSLLIPVKKLGLPVRSSRQFRRVNEAFIERLTQELIKEPCGSHGCLFVVAKGVPKKDSFDIDKRDAYEYEVLGGTHLMLATKQLHERYPENPHFAGRMAKVYCGLTDDQAVHLGAMHQKSSSYCHDVTYREEVETCRAQLYKNEEQNEDPPKPTASWRSTCAKILYKEKRNLSEMFTMALVSNNTWDAFMKVNDLFESGKLKGQKFSSLDISSGTLALKQWYMKPLVSLPDDSKLYLLNKVISGELLLKDLKREADEMRALSSVQSSIMSFFKIDSWNVAEQRFGSSVNSSKLLRFTGNFEASYNFQVFLERLKGKDPEIGNEDTSVEEISSSDVKNKGHVMFKQNLDEVTQGLDFFKSNFDGLHLTLASVGFDSTEQSDVEEVCGQLVDLINRVNFTLLSSFNCAIMCPASMAHYVGNVFKRKGATLTQQGFVYHKDGQMAKQGTTMQEVVSTFVVGHWAASRIVEGGSHTNYSSPPPNMVEVEGKGVGEEYPVSFFEKLIEWFSKDGDTVMEVGMGNENGNVFLAALGTSRNAVLLSVGTQGQTWVLQKLTAAL